MALTHTPSGQVVSVLPLGDRLAQATSSAILKAGQLEVMRVVLPAGKSMREAAQLASDRGLNCDPDGSGYAVSQSIPANTLVDKGTTVTVQFQSQ